MGSIRGLIYRKHKKKRRASLSAIVLWIAMLAGLAVAAYPSVSNWWNVSHAAQAISDYSDTVGSISDEDRAAMLAGADAYNKNLQGSGFELEDGALDEYMSQLNVTETGIMGHIEIPSIKVSLPIYHTVEEDVLQTAVGHIPGSSLPVGGEGTHAVLSGHRGLPSMKLFSDLDKLAAGDVFIITVLDRTMVYKVDQVRIVKPSEVKGLEPVAGKDYCTLVTCTPYGVNSHRMLVRGIRTDDLAGSVSVKRDASKVPGYLVMPFLAAPILFFALLAVFASGTRRVRGRKEILADIQKNGLTFEEPGHRYEKEDDDHADKET